MYTLNNPVKYADPSGHRATDGCDTEGCTTKQSEVINNVQAIANQQHQPYARCYQNFGSGCSALAEVVMDVKDVVEGVSNLIENSGRELEQ